MGDRKWWFVYVVCSVVDAEMVELSLCNATEALDAVVSGTGPSLSYELDSGTSKLPGRHPPASERTPASLIQARLSEIRWSACGNVESLWF